MFLRWAREGRWAGSCARSLLLLGCLGLSGCYRVTSLGSARTPDTDSRIVAELTRSGSLDMAPWIGEGASAVEGRVLSASSTEWELALTRVEYEGSASMPWNGERIVFPVGSLEEVRERQLDNRRSAVFAAAVTGAVAGLGFWFFGGGFGGGTDGPGGVTVPPE